MQLPQENKLKKVDSFADIASSPSAQALQEMIRQSVKAAVVPGSIAIKWYGNAVDYGSSVSLVDV